MMWALLQLVRREASDLVNIMVPLNPPTGQISTKNKISKKQDDLFSQKTKFQFAPQLHNDLKDLLAKNIYYL